MAALTVAGAGSVHTPTQVQKQTRRQAQTETTAPVNVAVDAEIGLQNSTSAQAIELGMRVAMSEINAAGGVPGGRPLKLMARDNLSMPARALVNRRELAQLPALVAVFGGKFSPVVIDAVPLAHELGLPFIAVWSLADPIIENVTRPNWMFRVALRDSLAMPKMLDVAQARGLQRLGLVITDYNMPEMPGMELMAALRRLRAGLSGPPLSAPPKATPAWQASPARAARPARAAGSAARAFGPVPFGQQQGHNLVGVVALHFQHSAPGRAAGPAGRAQALAHSGQAFGLQRQPAHHGDGLAAAALLFSRHACNAIPRRRGLRLRLAQASGQRLAARGAGAAGVGGIDEAALVRPAAVVVAHMLFLPQRAPPSSGSSSPRKSSSPNFGASAASLPSTPSASAALRACSASRRSSMLPSATNL